MLPKNSDDANAPTTERLCRDVRGCSRKRLPARENTVIGKVKGAMKKKSLVVFMGVVMMLAVAGCNEPKDKQKGDLTMAPSESATEAPDDMTPTNEAEITAPVQDETTYELTFTGKEETEEFKDGDAVYFRSAMYYPVFEGKYAENMNRFVTSVVEDFRETLSDSKESAQFDYEESKNNEYGVQIFPEAEELTVSCVWSKEQIVVMQAEYYSYMGGAHPSLFCKTFVVDATDGYKETLESVIRPYGVTTDEVVSFATARIREEHGEKLFPTDDEDALEKWVYLFTQMDQWYVNENGLVLFANPYDIAAYVYGRIECEISYEELEQGLKK